MPAVAVRHGEPALFSKTGHKGCGDAVLLLEDYMGVQNIYNLALPGSYIIEIFSRHGAVQHIIII